MAKLFYKLPIIAFTILCFAYVDGQNSTKTNIAIGALLPDFKFDRFNYRVAMEAAVELINQDEKYLKNHRLILAADESHDGGFLFENTIWDLLHKEPVKQLLLAGAFSRTSRKSTHFTTLFNLPQIAYGSRQRLNVLKEVNGQPVQFNRLEDKPFPYFVRLTPTIIRSNGARVKVIQQMKWKRVAILLEERSELMFHMANDLKIQLNNANIEIITTQSIPLDEVRATNKSNISAQMQALIDTNSKVIIALTTSEPLKNIFCEAFKRKLYGNEYIWMTTASISEHFYTATDTYNCTMEEYLQVFNGTINTEIIDYRSDSTIIIGNKTTPEIIDIIKEKRQDNLKIFNANNPGHGRIERPFYPLSLYAFDTVLTAAVTLDKIINEQGEDALLKDYMNSTKALEITREIFKSNFEGTTGRVFFGEHSNKDERVVQVSVKQLYSSINKGLKGQGRFENVALYDSFSDSLTVYNNTMASIFTDGIERKDGTITVNRILKVIPKGQIIGLWTMTLFGIILSLVFLVINVKHRTIRLIKMSSPNVNNGIVFGSLICYLSILLYGLDTRLISKKGMEINCNILPVCLSIGFTFTFGCLYSKTWRVYKIFSAARTMEKVNTNALKDIRLYIIVFVFIGIDVIISIAWGVISPFRVVDVVFDKQIVNDELVNLFFYHKCECTYQMHFTVIMYGYKGLLLVSGLFLAWETRNIKVAALNDSQFIGMAVYNVFVVTVVGVTCFYSLTDTENYLQHGYLIVAFSIFMCTVITVIVVFAPKVHLLFGRSINTSVERAMSVQTFSFAASVIRNSTRDKKVAPAVESSHREISSESSVP